jgi:hypothetical protein
MKHTFAALILLAAGAVSMSHAAPAPADYPSCRLDEQRAVTGEVGGAIKDPLQAHISVRINVLQADIGNARKARRLSQKQADALWKRADRVRRDTDRFVKQQGFLSAAERASYDRELGGIASTVCGIRSTPGH